VGEALGWLQWPLKAEIKLQDKNPAKFGSRRRKPSFAKICPFSEAVIQGANVDWSAVWLLDRVIGSRDLRSTCSNAGICNQESAGTFVFSNS
jgi:hypothetical protein